MVITTEAGDDIGPMIANYAASSSQRTRSISPTKRHSSATTACLPSPAMRPASSR
jgi:hypothetical protein